MSEDDKERLLPQQAEPLDKGFRYRISAPYKYRNRYNDKIAEFDIDYYSKNDIKDLVAFIREYSDRIINIRFRDGIDEEVLKTLVTLFSNFRVRIDISDFNYIETFKENHIKWFFDKNIVINNHTMLESIVKLEPSCIYIGDDLAYNMDTVSQICHDANIQVRCVLNRIPSTAFDCGTNVRDYIYDPRTIDELADYYDCFEFNLGPDPIEWNKWDVLYTTFFIDKKWVGDLREINEDLRFEYIPTRIMPTFPIYKANCGKRCVARYTNHCNRCQHIIEDMQQVLIDKGAKFKE